MRNSLLAIAATLCLVASAPPTRAQDPFAPTTPSALRLVTVTGKAEIKVEPDYAILNFTITTLNLDVTKAKEDNDAIVMSARTAAIEKGVKAEDIQLSRINIDPVYESSYYSVNRYKIINYKVRRKFSVKILDLKEFDTILTALVASKVTEIDAQFHSERFLQLRQEAREMAVDAAKAKAEAMAKKLGAEINRVHSIDEQRKLDSFWFEPSISNASNVASDLGANSEQDQAFGRIVVEAEVQVSFELK